MPKQVKTSKRPSRSYRVESKICPKCGQVLKRSHIAWRKTLIFSTGPEIVTSWAYQCDGSKCVKEKESYKSEQAERLHLKHRRYSREIIVKIGYRRFWHHRTMYEIYEWLNEELGLKISERQVLNLIGDFLALLRAGQAANIKQKLGQSNDIVIGIDGMQPEKGNKSLYLIREPRVGLTLMAENLDEGANEILSDKLLNPLKSQAEQLGLKWQGVVSDAQQSIRLAVANSLPGVPHQACQSHCLRDAGQLTFAADRSMKKRLKAAFRQPIKRLRNRIQRLPLDNLYRPILLDYAEAIHATLLKGGVAPFDLGGVWVFEALNDLAASVSRCQKKGTINSCLASLP